MNGGFACRLGDVLSMNVAGASCPFCSVWFKVSTGFMSHLIVDHWCERELALVTCSKLASYHPQMQAGFFPIHLEIH